MRKEGRRKERRQFLWFAGTVLAQMTFGVRIDALPQSRKMPTPPEAAEPQPNAPDAATARISQRAILQQHEKEFRDSLARLAERVNGLRGEIEQVHSADIFSIKIYKETSEIEHLAKQLKTLAKG